MGRLLPLELDGHPEPGAGVAAPLHMHMEGLILPPARHHGACSLAQVDPLCASMLRDLCALFALQQVQNDGLGRPRRRAALYCG